MRRYLIALVFAALVPACPADAQQAIIQAQLASRPPAYTTATLPRPDPSNPGRIAYLTDGVKGLCVDNGTQWTCFNRFQADPTAFGADPTGANDSVRAFQAAADTVAAAGGGILRPSPGTYKLNSASVGLSSNTLLDCGGPGAVTLTDSSAAGANYRGIISNKVKSGAVNIAVRNCTFSRTVEAGSVFDEHIYFERVVGGAIVGNIFNGTITLAYHSGKGFSCKGCASVVVQGNIFTDIPDNSLAFNYHDSDNTRDYGGHLVAWNFFHRIGDTGPHSYIIVTQHNVSVTFNQFTGVGVYPAVNQGAAIETGSVSGRNNTRNLVFSSNVTTNVWSAIISNVTSGIITNNSFPGLYFQTGKVGGLGSDNTDLVISGNVGTMFYTRNLVAAAITNNIAEGSPSGAQCYSLYGTYLTITNNLARDCGSTGMEMYASPRGSGPWTVKGNTAINVGISSALGTRFGFVLGGCVDCLYEGNVASDFQRVPTMEYGHYIVGGTRLAFQNNASNRHTTDSFNFAHGPALFTSFSGNTENGGMWGVSRSHPWPAVANGNVVYCSTCQANSNPCVGDAKGAMAKRLNGAWDCR